MRHWVSNTPPPPPPPTHPIARGPPGPPRKRKRTRHGSYFVFNGEIEILIQINNTPFLVWRVCILPPCRLHNTSEPTKGRQTITFATRPCGLAPEKSSSAKQNVELPLPVPVGHSSGVSVNNLAEALIITQPKAGAKKNKNNPVPFNYWKPSTVLREKKKREITCAASGSGSRTKAACEGTVGSMQ